MQPMPPTTARWVARRRWAAPPSVAPFATDADHMLFSGAYYFKYWLDRLERLPALAAAAYNAGPKRAQAWRTGTPLEGAIWVETIPFNETPST